MAVLLPAFLTSDIETMNEYEPGVFPLRAKGAIARPERGAAIVEREAADKQRIATEREIATKVKQREGYRCRWPEAHTCRGGPLEAAHLVNKSQGGTTSLENEIAVCPWIHRRGPESLHGQQLKVEKETERGANGPLSFWRQTGEFDALGQPIYFCVARERAPGIVERD